MDYLITLIHGTFARNASYLKEGSDFRNSIDKNLEGHNVEYYCYNWTGKNSHQSRIDAAEMLALELQRQIECYPEKKKVIIAHSHGGNVAMYALRNLQSNATHFNLITIGTPFLNATKRNLKVNIGLYSRILSWMIAIPIFYIVYLLLLFANSLEKLEAKSIVAYLAIAIPLIIIVIYLIFSGLIAFVGDKVTDHISRFLYKVDLQTNFEIEKLSYGPNKRHLKHLVIIDQGDEIRFWFGSLFKVWEGIFSIHSLVMFLGRIIYIPTLITISMMIVFVLRKWRVPKFFLYSFFGVGVMFIVAVISLILPLLFYIIKSNLLTLGRESLRHQMLIRIEPSITPLSRNVELIQYNFRRRLWSLKHGIYEKEKVRKYICFWMLKLKG